jgi:hypothetical protein
MKKLVIAIAVLVALAAVQQVQACNGFAQKQVIVRQQKVIQPVQKVVVQKQVVVRQQVIRPAKVVFQRQKVFAPVVRQKAFARPAFRSFGRACST